MTIFSVSSISRVLKEISPGDRSAGKRDYIAIFLFILFSTSIACLIGLQGAKPAYFPGWYVLELLPGADLEEAALALESAGVEGALSEVSADVPVMMIPGTERIAVAELDRVLPPGDPRRDPYVAGVPELFRSGASSLVYLPADKRLGEYERIVADLPELSGSVFPDASGPAGALPAILFSAVVLALFAVMRGRRFAVAVSSIPLFAFMLIVNPNDAFPVIAVFCATVFLGFRGWRGALSAATIAASLFLLAATGGMTDLLSASVALAGAAAAFLAFPAAKGAGEESTAEKGAGKRFRDGAGRSTGRRRPPWKRTDHALFEPVSLLTAPAAPPMRIPFGEMAAGAAILICFAASWIVADTREPLRDPIPAVGESYGDAADWSALAKLDSSRDYGNLPDLAALVASAAHQEGFLYGAEYRLPMPGESLSIRRYEDRGGKIVAGETQVTDYDREWLEETLEREMSGGVGRLFSGTREAAAIRRVRTKPVSVIVDAGATALAVARVLVITFAAILLFVPFGAADRRIKHRTPINISRRRAQAA